MQIDTQHQCSRPCPEAQHEAQAHSELQDDCPNIAELRQRQTYPGDGRNEERWREDLADPTVQEQQCDQETPGDLDRLLTCMTFSSHIDSRQILG
jgi:hypothetical protein